MSLLIIISELFTHIFVPLLLLLLLLLLLSPCDCDFFLTTVTNLNNSSSVGYISQLDDIAFSLAKAGRFGPMIEAETKEIKKRPLPRCIVRKNKHVRYFWTVFITGILLLGLTISVLVFQKSKHKWTTKTLRIQFQDQTGLQAYNGCYQMDHESDGDKKNTNNRYTYENYDKDKDQTAFGYCFDEQRWVLFKDSNNNSTPCIADELIHSSKTDTFDISSSFDEPWYSSSGEPVSLYFFEQSDVEKDDCLLFLNDGNCDSSFNTIDYLYDEGDCCAGTCTQSNCGFGGLTSAFGSANIRGDGYSNCIDSSMIPITIHLDSIYGNYDANIAAALDQHAEKFNLTDDDNYSPPDYDSYREHLDKEPINPLLFLDCNGNNMISIFVEESMENASETIMVEDGANCIMTVQNTTGGSKSIFDKTPILHINYTVFHGDKTSMKHNPIFIVSGQTSVQDTTNFRIVSKCYFRKLVDIVDNTTLYSGSIPANKAIDWMIEDKSGNSDCKDPFFIERYALNVLSYSAPVKYTNYKDYNRFLRPIMTYTDSSQLSRSLTSQPTFKNESNSVLMNNVSSSAPNSTITIPWISSRRQCAWPQIVCKIGSVVSLKLISTEELSIEGSIATEIALLTNLEALMLGTF